MYRGKEMVRRGFMQIIVLFFIILFSLSYPSTISCAASSFTANKASNSYNILIDLDELKLYLLNKDTNKIVKTYPISGGKRSTPSPIGTWTIINKGEWDKGFGTRWMGLNVPWGQYGIHGTNKPLTIGGSYSLGCIRMINKDIEELYKLVDNGTTVVIYGGPYGLYENEFRILIPGNVGSDVYEVERRLKDIGYYSGALDGIYGEELKSAAIKFRKNNKLTITHIIDTEFYNALEMKSFE